MWHVSFVTWSTADNTDPTMWRRQPEDLYGQRRSDEILDAPHHAAPQRHLGAEARPEEEGSQARRVTHCPTAVDNSYTDISDIYT